MKTLSKGCPGLRRGVRGQLEDLRSQGQQWVWSDTSTGVSRTGGRVGRERERERERNPSPRFSLSSQVSTESL